MTSSFGKHPAVLVAAGAVLLAVTSAGSATAGAMITGAEIKNGTITSADIKNGTIKRADLGPSARIRGPRGAAGADGVLGYEIVTATSPAVGNGASGSIRAVCPAGKQVLGGGASWASGGAGSSTLSRVAVETFTPDGTSSHPTTADANAMYAEGINSSGGTRNLIVYAVCATVSS